MLRFICFIFLSLISCLEAYDASPRCYKDLELNFFQPSLVTQALSLHHVDQAIWTPILHLLQENSKKVPSMVRLKAKNLRPNPFAPVFIAEDVKLILMETLYEVFFSSVSSYNFYQNLHINADDIRAMFQYITDKQERRINNCFGVPVIKK